MIELSVCSKPRRDDGMTLVQTREPNRMRGSPVRRGPHFPDLVLFSQGRGRKLEAVIEVETGGVGQPSRGTGPVGTLQ